MGQDKLRPSHASLSIHWLRLQSLAAETIFLFFSFSKVAQYVYVLRLKQGGVNFCPAVPSRYELSPGLFVWKRLTLRRSHSLSSTPSVALLFLGGGKQKDFFWNKCIHHLVQTWGVFAYLPTLTVCRRRNRICEREGENKNNNPFRDFSLILPSQDGRTRQGRFHWKIKPFSYN